MSIVDIQLAKLRDTSTACSYSLQHALQLFVVRYEYFYVGWLLRVRAHVEFIGLKQRQQSLQVAGMHIYDARLLQ